MTKTKAQIQQLLYGDGKTVLRGVCVKTDHVREIFEVEISSMHGVSIEAMKMLLQKLYKVESCKIVDKKVYVQDC